jgi:hypothetical protein
VLEATTIKLAETHEFEERGVVDVKGIGPLNIYFLNRRLEASGNGAITASTDKQSS